MAEHHDRGIAFEQHVMTVLALRGYAVERDVMVGGTQMDLVARSNDPLNDLELMVECNAGRRPVGIELVKLKAGILVDADDRQRLLFVSAAGFTRAAKEYAERRRNIVLKSIQELEATLLDLRPYTRWLVEQFERSEGMFAEAQLVKTYVPLRCTMLGTGAEQDLAATVASWIAEDRAGLLFVLGEYGRGKTSFCRHFSYERCRVSDAGAVGPIPLLINLRDYRRSQSLAQIITDTLLNTYGVRISSFAHFQRFCATGRVMLVLDGFDEMSESGHPADTRRCFQEIYTLGALGTKTIVTCRTNYFRSHQELINLLDGFALSIDDSADGVELSFKGLAKLVEVLPFTDSEVFDYFGKRFGAKADGYLKTLKSIHDLTDLSRRPVLLDMICETLPILVGSAQNINSASLYEIYTKRWTRRDGWRTTLDENVRQDFCEALAWFTHLTDAETVSHDLIRDAVTLGLSGAFRTETELEVFLNDIRTCSFFVRSAGESQYRFAHKSFREFFVARRLVRELTGGRVPTRAAVEEFVAKRSQRDAESQARARAAHERASIRLKRRNATAKSMQVETSGGRDVLVGFLHRDVFVTGPLERIRGQIISIAGRYDLDIAPELERYIRDRAPLVSSTGSLEDRTADSFIEILRQLFVPTSDGDFLSSLRITPEIATFAVEILLTSQLAPIPVLEGLTEHAERVAFVTLLQSGPSRRYLEAHAGALIEWIAEGAPDSWPELLAPLIARDAPRLENAQIERLAARLPEDGLSRFMLGLLESPHDYRDAFASCFQLEHMTPVQAVLCRYGKRREHVSSVDDLLTTDVIVELIGSTKDRERPIVEGLLKVGGYSAQRAGQAIVKEIRTVTEEERRLWLAELLSLVIEGLTLPQIRGLEAVERYKPVLDVLHDVERQLLDHQSRGRLRTAADEMKHRRP